MSGAEMNDGNDTLLADGGTTAKSVKSNDQWLANVKCKLVELKQKRERLSAEALVSWPEAFALLNDVNWLRRHFGRSNVDTPNIPIWAILPKIASNAGDLPTAPKLKGAPAHPRCDNGRAARGPAGGGKTKTIGSGVPKIRKLEVALAKAGISERGNLLLGQLAERVEPYLLKDSRGLNDFPNPAALEKAISRVLPSWRRRARRKGGNSS